MLKLNFKYIEACNMCNASKTSFKTIGIRLNTSQGFKPSNKSGIAVTIAKCGVCGLVFANPQPLPDSFDDQYGISVEEYWNAGVPEWEEGHFKSEIDVLRSLGFSFNNTKALDIGAGYGRCMLSLQHVGMDVYGFEPAKEFHKLGITKFGLSAEKLQLSTIEDADYMPGQFDFITFGAVLEHVHDPDASLKKAIKWLRPGGLIHIEVPSARWYIAKLYNFYYKNFCRSNFVTNVSPMHSPFHHFEFTREAFEKNGITNGYEISFFKIEVCETTMPVKFLDGILKRWMKLTGTGMQVIVFLRKKG